MNSLNEFYLTKKQIINNNDLFVKRPVLDIINKINESDKRVVILSGLYDSGKRLTSLEYMNELYEENSIGLYFNSIINNNYQKAINENKIDAYIEVKIALQLLKVIRNLNIPIDPILLKLNLYTHIISKDINMFELKNYECGDLVCPLLYVLKKGTGMKKFNLVLNNIDGLDKKLQEKFKNYFDLFDKNILLINDEVVYNSVCRRELLTNKEYEIINVDYAKNYSIAEELIDSRVIYHNKMNKEDNLFKICQMVDHNDFEDFVDALNGNIRYILSTMKEFYRNEYKPKSEGATGYVKNKTNQSKSLVNRNLYPLKKLYL